MPALVALGLVALGLWGGARIVEATTDDPDIPNEAPSNLPLYAGLAIAGLALWAVARR